jgi:lycopene cyclase-like protein
VVPSENTNLPVLIVGAGPAGLALAGALGERGVAVTVVDPDPERPFANSYGIWSDEADELRLQPAVAARTTTTRVTVGKGKSHSLSRGYARLHAGRLQELLLEQVQRTGGRLVAAEAGAAEHAPDAVTLHLKHADALHGALVVDATGHSPALLRPGGRVPAWQVAYGQTLRLKRSSLPEDTTVLMDFSPVDARDAEGPTFLYAMPEGEGLLFVEETILATASPPDMAWLQDRLARRLRTLGIEGEVVAEERCRFPMGVALPPTDQPVLGFGAAAGLVHPATGYMLARTLRLAGPLADTLQAGLAHGERGDTLAARGWRALWPQTRLASHRLHRFGLDVLLALDADKTRQFFDAFFTSGGDGWRAYLDADSPAEELASVMLGMAAHLPARLVRVLAQEAMRRPAILPELGSHLPRLLLPKRPSLRLRSTP